MSSVRSGRGTRSSSRRPWGSNRHSSTRLALAENRAKLVPRPSHVAPRGYGRPSVSRIHLKLRNEKERGKRRKGEANLEIVALLDCRNHAPIADIAAAIDCGVGVQRLVPITAERHPYAIIVAHLGREVHDNEATCPAVAPLAHPRERTLLPVVHDDPLEPVGIAVELVQCGQCP